MKAVVMRRTGGPEVLEVDEAFPDPVALPGEALVQIPGLKLGIPALAHLIVGALALLAWYQILRQHADPAASAVGVLALGLSPNFLLTGATGHSQLTALSCVVFAGLGNMWGALFGALLFGLVGVMSVAYLTPGWSDFFAYLFVVLVLIFRPRGVFGTPYEQPR